MTYTNFDSILRLSTFSYFTSQFLFGKAEKLVPYMGRLVKLYEAAGKIRVIGVVDPITNWLLKPLHDWIFSILAQIPQDGTFNQDKPLKEL